jgi:hypothetical protein
MKNKKFIFLLFLNFWTCPIVSAGYHDKYHEVIEKFSSHSEDSLKYRAAMFLIDNMDGHSSPNGNGIKKYVSIIQTLPPRTNIGKLADFWRQCHQRENITKMVNDSSIVSSKELISNVEDAYTTWIKSPWKKDVPFDNFCRYILPYKVLDEYVIDCWRNQLRDLYKDVVAGQTDIKKAFVALRKAVLDKVKNSVTYTPYNLDVLSYEHIQRANCQQRCILLASVLRSFGIPAAIDNVPYWADYSTMGHSWVSLILINGKTLTVYEDEDEAKENNRIDASLFLKDTDGPLSVKNFLHNVKYEKKVSKIYRTEFKRINQKVDFKDWFIDPFTLDVSNLYGLQGSLSLKVKDNNITQIYLCTYVTGKNWYPIARETVSKNKAVFNNLGKGVVYLPVYVEGRKFVPLKDPLLVAETSVKRFKKNEGKYKSITIERKYPLCSYMPVQWAKVQGSIFEGANDSIFSNPDTLAVILNIPNCKTTINVRNNKSYRYVRFKSPDKEIGLMSEISFFSKCSSDEELLKGKYISENVDINTIPLLFDDDIETKIKAYKSGYWVGLDLGTNQIINKISFTPVSDGNDIQKDHLYELYGFNSSWELLGRCYSKENAPLAFDRVPSGMLLLLKDKTKGKEERIFDDVNNEQIWY